MPKGVTVWLTGLSGAGKTTICQRVEQTLRASGFPAEWLDGDEVRRKLCPDLGFSREDRFRNVRRVSYVAKLLTGHGVIVLVSMISPYRSMREEARAEIGRFAEVYVKCSLGECIRRDVKGLYRQALDGMIPQFTGISDPYEEPEHPDLTVDTEQDHAETCATQVVDYLLKNGYLA